MFFTPCVVSRWVTDVQRYWSLKLSLSQPAESGWSEIPGPLPLTKNGLFHAPKCTLKIFSSIPVMGGKSCESLAYQAKEQAF